jgi:beta-N-acetylhexosaminidase
VIRREIGFAGLLMSDDLSMKALSGPMGQRAGEALRAGCDLVLHCNGAFGEMIEIAAAASTLSDEAASRASAALALRRPPPPFDPEAQRRRLEQALTRKAAA